MIIRFFLFLSLAFLCIDWSYAITISPSILQHAVVKFRAGGKGSRKSNNNAKTSTRGSSTKTYSKSSKGGSGGGRSKNRSSRGGSGKKKKNVSNWTSSGKKKSRRSERMDLMPYGSNKNKGGRGTAGKLGSMFTERFGDLSQGVSKGSKTLFKDFYRRAKVMRSSGFEGMLLKATWPGDAPVPHDILGEIIKYSIPAFKFTGVDSEDDPYYMTMHKLWTKMCEKDWRTTIKALYILHAISRDCELDACESFAIAIKDMSKTRNPKKPDHKYFDTRVISDLDVAGERFESFVRQYSAYVLYRAKNFSGKFQELQDLTLEGTGNKATNEKKAIAILKRTQQAVELALHINIPSGKANVNQINGFVVKMVCNDLMLIWKYFGEKVAALVADKKFASHTVKGGESLAEILRFYRETGSTIEKYLKKASKSFASIRLKIPAVLEVSDSEVDDVEVKSLLTEAKIADRIRALTNISGGARRRVQYEEDDDDEDDYYDDDDEDEDEEEDEDEDDYYDEDEDDDDEEEDDDLDEDDDEEEDDDFDEDDDEEEDDEEDDDDDENMFEEEDEEDDMDEDDDDDMDEDDDDDMDEDDDDDMDEDDDDDVDEDDDDDVDEEDDDDVDEEDDDDVDEEEDDEEEEEEEEDDDDDEEDDEDDDDDYDDDEEDDDDDDY